jgi:hypothetical protein
MSRRHSSEDSSRRSENFTLFMAVECIGLPSRATSTASSSEGEHFLGENVVGDDVETPTALNVLPPDRVPSFT